MNSCSNCGRKNDSSKECVDCITTINGGKYPTKWIPESEPDLVNNPPHYNTRSGLDTIKVIEAFTEDLVGYEATNTGNILKYICRWKKKNGLQDLKKAQWYLNHLIRLIEVEESKNVKEN